MLDLHSAATKYNFFDDGRGLKLVFFLNKWLWAKFLFVQGEPECNIGGVVECGPYCWSAATH